MTIEEKKRLTIEALKRGDSLAKIGRDIFKSTGTGSVNAFIDRYGIPVSQYGDRYLYMNFEWLQKQLKTYGTPGEVAKVFNMPRTSVTRYAERFGLYSAKFSRTQKNDINEAYFEDIDNAQKAYWLGFIMADGNIYHYKNSDKVQFELKIKQEDKEHLEIFADAISFPKDKIRSGSAMRKGSETYYASIRSYNKSFCNNLIKHGIVDRKSGKEFLPKEIPMEFQRDFVRGFWDGDGHLSQHDIFVASLSFDLIANFSSFFCRSSILSMVSKKTTSTGKDLFFLDISFKSFNDFKNLIYYDGCLGLPRKINAIRDIRSTKYGE